MKRTFEQLAVQFALKKMFETSTYFCVVEFRRILVIVNIKVTEAEDSIMAMLHCVQYSTMTPEFISLLKERVLENVGRNELYRFDSQFEFTTELESSARGRRFEDVESNTK